MNVKLISLTEPLIPELTDDAESLLAYCARVSNPENQSNTRTAANLLKYCAQHGHWSVFEMADMTVEIQTCRAISTQILRHRSFSFQEFSQRYSPLQMKQFTQFAARRQDPKNRQNSVDDMAEEDKQWFLDVQKQVQFESWQYYQTALRKGIAKEQARLLLPLGSPTTMYMKGSIRSWIHYCKVRCDPSTQLEHRDIANACKGLLIENFPSLEGLV